MGSIFKHTNAEPGLWRGWFSLGRSDAIEISWPRLGLALEVANHNRGEHRWMLGHVHLGPVNAYFPIPVRAQELPIGEISMSWGASLFETSVHLNWGSWCKIVALPWFAWGSACRHEILNEAGKWVPYVASWKYPAEPDGRKIFIFDYSYTLKSGAVQQRTATVYESRMAWRRKWFGWSKLFERERRYVGFTFSDEVGERSGSWKGGVIGSSETMLTGETVEQTFRRMERERKF